MTIPARHPFAALAEFFEYPSPGSFERWESLRQGFEERWAEAHALLGQFIEAARAQGDELESVFLNAFEITPACVPYVGVHLFGEENFKRSAFMAQLNRRYRELDLAAGTELPDHIAMLLKFADRIEGEEQRDLFEFCLLGPLRKMLAHLAPAHPYAPLLRAVTAVAQAGFPGLQAAPLPVETQIPRAYATGAAGAPCRGSKLNSHG